MASTAGLVVDIVDLPQQVGTIKNVHLNTTAPADLGAEMIGAQEGSPLTVDAELTSLDNGVLVRGNAEIHLRGQCVRCLRDIAEDTTISFDELYFTPEAARAQAAEGDEEADELFLVGDATLDLEPALRDALVLALPFQPLCRPDCAGLCSQCGERLDDLPAGHHHEQLDPRWSALAALLPEAQSSASADAGAADDSKDPDAPHDQEQR
ncbi:MULTISPECIES: DUF177 domain-containing protein [unclassified Actinomyces]|uniref:YceD family protein n=1 Tax=unclassified Actinomyces TaxID=2609248 RepID=UPI0013A6FB4B|nr:MULTISPECIES: DUF177 domain-containing protein [unclassified Actinomyces]MBW3069943.1 DUF177 domain-containing protein [Actinomyces sp. 594]NDR53986.1 DUF177 domain-containing protein [Actinomyces sp. 565]